MHLDILEAEITQPTVVCFSSVFESLFVRRLLMWRVVQGVIR